MFAADQQPSARRIWIYYSLCSLRVLLGVDQLSFSCFLHKRTLPSVSFFFIRFYHRVFIKLMYVASSIDEKDRFVSSIIKTLEADEVLRLSMANCRAYVFRAEVYGQAGRLDESVADAERAIQLLRSASSPSSSSKSAPLLLAKAYRVLADTYEQTGNCELAIKALQGAAAADPASRTKLSKEMQRLQQRVAESS